MVGDRQVLIAALARRQRHLLDRVVAVRGDRVAVQVAADVRQLDQLGAGRMRGRFSRGGRRARRGPRAARARCRRGRAARTPRCSLAHVACSPVASSRTPYSETCRPAPHRGLAQRRVVRARAGEVLQQVAELRRLGDAQVDAHARVGARPGARLAGRRHAARSLEARRGAWRASPVASSTATRSRSLTLSASRRAEPAICTCGARPARSVRPAASASPISSALGSRMRTARAGASVGVRRHRSSASSTLASNFGPRPRTVRRRCASAASRSASSESIPSSECSRRARLGPRPGRCVIAIRPGGKLRAQLLRRGDRARARAAPGSSPAASRRCPGARSRGPSRASAATDTDASRTLLAALR